MDMATALIIRLFDPSEIVTFWFPPWKPTNTTPLSFLALERARTQLQWYRAFPKRLGGKEIPDLAWLYHRRFVSLCSHPALRQKRSNPDSHISTPSLTLKETAPALPPLFLLSHGSKCLPSSFSVLQQHIHMLRHALSMQKVPVFPSPLSLSHPAPQKDHSKSLHHPCRGSSPGSTTGEPPHRKTEEWAMQPADRELHLPFGVTHICHLNPSLKALCCRGMRSPKGPISHCINITAQHWHFVAFRFYV